MFRHIYRNRELEFGGTVGFDIEFALVNTRGKFVSAIPYVPGTKKEPHMLDDGNVQRDNIAFEIAVDYADDAYVIEQNIRSVLQQSLGLLPKGYKLLCVPSATFDPVELKHAEAKEFGCDADYDAKTQGANEFNGIVDPNFRSFGLHVHTGDDEGMSPLQARLHILASDMVLGLYSTMKDNSRDALLRRNLYGKPSCYRKKDYGVEYRTLSNYWCQSPRLIETVLILNAIANEIAWNHRNILFEKVDMYDLADVIMTGNHARATNLFFDLVYKDLCPNARRLLLAELETDTYRSLTEEWMLDDRVQTLTKYEALRPDYYAAPIPTEEAIIL